MKPRETSWFAMIRRGIFCQPITVNFSPGRGHCTIIYASLYSDPLRLSTPDGPPIHPNKIAAPSRRLFCACDSAGAPCADPTKAPGYHAYTQSPVTARPDGRRADHHALRPSRTLTGQKLPKKSRADQLLAGRNLTNATAGVRAYRQPSARRNAPTLLHQASWLKSLSCTYSTAV